MLRIQNLSYHIGERVLFNDINWTISPGQRIGFIGPNGAGKTTLLRLIMGELPATSGTVSKPGDFTVGYLPQEEIRFGSGPILNLVMAGQQKLVQMEAEIDAIQRELSTSDTQDAKRLEKLGALEAQYAVLSGYELKANAKKVLEGLGFGEDDFPRPLSDLSGGWRMRVYLGRLLLQQPRLLLLDEPTNHLDIESLEWLENYLKAFKGGLVIVSHDRFFIDRLSHEIVELAQGRLTHFSGNYHFYEQKKALLLEQTLKNIEEQKAERERLEKFINRFRYKATKARQVQSRIKRLEKMELIELPEERQTIHFRIKADVQSFKDVLHLDNVFFRYDTKWVLQNLDLHLYRGDKAALVGVNGAGKTTLTRLISGELSPQRGNLHTGERVHIIYYAQHQTESLELDKSIFEQVQSSAAPSLRPHVRDILGVFRFSGDDVYKKAGILSGGEKARVSLAKILISPGNFLIMDEPTNHLDQQSKKALEKALQDYDGTLMLISHDRYFLDKLVNKVFELKDGQLKMYEGNYSAYLEKREQALQAEERQAVKTEMRKAEKPRGRQKKSKEQKQKEAQARQAISAKRRQLENTIKKLEDTISKMEEKKAELENMLADPQTYQNPQQAAKLKKEYDAMLLDLKTAEDDWERNHLHLEALMESVL